MDDDDVEYFKPTSGRLTGGAGIVAAFGIVVLASLDGLHDSDLAVVLGCAFFGVLAWAALLRPRVGVSCEHLLLRNLISEVSIPLASIGQLVLRQVLAVSVEGRRYVSPAVGRSLRSLRPRRAGTPPDFDADTSYCDVVEERIRDQMANARARAEAAPADSAVPAVRRTWAWPEIIALAVTGSAFVLTLLH